MSGIEWLVAVVILLGVLGTLIPVLPGPFLTLGGVFIWAVAQPSTTGWTVFAVCAVIVVAGFGLSYVVPGRRLAKAGVPRASLLGAAAAAIVGFFVIPVVGLPIGFVAGLYLMEVQRLGAGEARTSTVLALKAVALNIAIDLATALAVAAIWLTAAVQTPVPA